MPEPGVCVRDGSGPNEPGRKGQWRFSFLPPNRQCRQPSLHNNLFVWQQKWFLFSWKHDLILCCLPPLLCDFLFLKKRVWIFFYFMMRKCITDCNSNVNVSEWNGIRTNVRRGGRNERFYVLYRMMNCTIVYILSYQFILIKRTSHKPLYDLVIGVVL